MKEIGKEYIAGIDTYFKYSNQIGLLKNKELKLAVYDDQYEPYITRQNISSIISNYKKNLIGILGVVGTPTSEEAMNLAVKNDIPFLFALSGASFLYQDYSKIYSFRPSYQQEAKKIAEFIHKRGYSDIALLYQNDSYGINALNEITKELNKKNKSIKIEGVYSRNTISIYSAYQDIKKANPQIVIMAGAYKPTVHFISQAYKDNQKWKFVNFSFVGLEQLSKIDPKYLNSDNIYITQPLKPLTMQSETEKIFATEYKKYYPSLKLTSTAYEGFLVGMIVTKALSNLEYVTKKEFLAQLNRIKQKLDYMQIDYTKNNNGLDKVYLIDIATKGVIDE
jgi:ABC-type branched-subunit amino acid transport system substrate-binding protein